MTDHYKQIAIFTKVIELGSFRAAATELQLSPSVISHHISSLEQALGVALIYRSTRQISLTAEGARLFYDAQASIHALDRQIAALQNQAQDPAGTIRVSMLSALARSHLMARFAAFQKAHPKVKLELHFSDKRIDLVKEGFELALRARTDRSKNANRRSLFQSKRRLMASRDFMKARSYPERPEEVQDWDWIVLSQLSNFKPVFHSDDAGAVQIQPAPKIKVSDVQALYQFVKLGAGVGVVPDMLIPEGEEKDALEVLLPNWSLPPIEVFAEWPRNLPQQGLVKRLVDMLADPSK